MTTDIISKKRGKREETEEKKLSDCRLNSRLQIRDFGGVEAREGEALLAEVFERCADSNVTIPTPLLEVAICDFKFKTSETAITSTLQFLFTSFISYHPS